LISAFAECLSATLAEAQRVAAAKVPVILTAHSVPERTIAEGDVYDQQVKETAGLVAERVGLTPQDWAFAYQSQGMTEEGWLGPTVESAIDRASVGHRHVIVYPIGFVCDHVEILYDIDIVFRSYAEARGMRLWRPESLNDHPLLIAALRELALRRVTAAT
jgi:ferrochelatase